MKKKLKLLAITISIASAAVLSLDGSNGLFTTARGQSSSQKWKLERVTCYDGNGKAYAIALGCFSGNDPICNPLNCPPVLPPNPPNPPD